MLRKLQPMWWRILCRSVGKPDTGDALTFHIRHVPTTRTHMNRRFRSCKKKKMNEILLKIIENESVESHQSKATTFHLGHRVVTFEQLVHVLGSFYSKWAVEQSSRLFTGSIPRVGNTTNLHDDLVCQVQRRSTCNETFER